MKRTSLVLSFVLAISALAQTDTIHREDFQSYKTPSNPPGWVDTSVGNPKPQASGLYKAWNDPLQGTNVVYGTKQSSGNPEGNNPRIGTFSTLTTKTFDAKGRFEYSGRLIRTKADSRIGLTFLSSYPEVDKYYLIGLWSQPNPTNLTMQLFGFGAGTLQGTVDSNLTIDINRWYRFVIQVDDVDNATKIRARFWPDGTTEPTTFSIDAVDAAPSRLTTGRIGMWAAVKGDAYIDDLYAKSPVDHAPPVITFVDADTQRVLDPAELALFKTPARIEIRVTDDLSTFTYTAKLDGATDYESATPIAVDGMHEITVNAVDGPGNTATASLDLLVDQVPPVITLNIDGATFAPGAIFNHDVVLSASIQDISATTTAATLDGATVALPQPIAGERLHDISVTATDRVDWQSTSVSSFVVDKTPPVVTILANGIELGGGESFQTDVTLTWSATDLTFDRIEATLNGAPITSGTTVTAERVHDLVVIAYDKAAHSTTESRRFVLDKTAPELRVLANAETFVGGTTFNAPVTFTAEVNDATPTTAVATIDDQLYNLGNSYGVEGPHTIKIVVTDATGLTTTVGPSPFTIDRTQPTVALTESGAPFPDGMKFNRDVHPVVTASDNLTANPTRELTLNGLSYPLDTPIAEERVDHIISAKATDAGGNSASVGPFHFLIDKTRPVVTLTDEASGKPFAADALFARAVRVKVTVVDMTVTTIAATLNGQSFDVNAPVTGDGTYTVSVVATDEVGWTSEPVTATFTIDTTPPHLTFTSHAEGAIVTTPSVIVSGGSDDAVVVSIDGSPVTLDFAAKTFLSDNVALVEGPNTIVVTGTDKAGNIGTAALRLELDTRAPDFAIVAPSANACIAAGEIVVRGTARDAVAIRVRAGEGTPVDAAISGSEWTATVPLPAEGKIVLFVEAIDRAGHVSNAVVPVTVDRTRPVIVATEGGTAFTGTLFNRVLAPLVRVTDADVNATLTVTLDGNPFVVGTVLRDDATHVLRATATDCAGNSETWEMTFTIDRTPPRIESFSPADGATVGNEPLLSGTLSEPATVVEEVSGVAATVDGVHFTMPAAWEEGINERVFVATDRAGNVSRTPYTLRVKTAAPVVEIVESGAAIPANALYNRIVKPVIRVGDPAATINATLNGAAFASGTNVSADASYTLTATATDTLGHVSDPVTATFAIDRTPPHIDITSPAEGASIATTNVEVSGTVDVDATSVTINGVAATISGTSFLANIVLEHGSSLVSGSARDRAGNLGYDRVEITRTGGPLAILLTSPPDEMLTNRPTTVVAGQVLTQPPSGTVEVNGINIPVTAGGTFRKIDFPLVEGANTITASVTSANGARNSVSVDVHADYTAPVLRVTANALELADGARFAVSPQLAVDATDDIPQGLVTELTIDGAQITGAIPTFADGGHALSAIARDAAGNETRTDRTFFVGDSVSASGCGLSNIDPIDGSAVFAELLRITGRSGGAASVLINGNAAQVADGSFCGEASLVPGRNEVVIRCADANGNPTSDPPVTLVVYRDVEPTIAITSPASGSTVTTATVTVTGTVGAGVVSGDVNGLAFEVPRDGAESHTFSVPNVTLSAGLNTVIARAKTGAGRITVATARVTLLNAAPQLFITSPIEGTETGASSVDVTGGYVNVDPSTIAVNGAAATTTASSSTSGTFRATVSLAAGLASVITAGGRNAAGVEARDTVEIQHVVGAPSIAIASPADNIYLPSTASVVAVSGTFDAAPGSQVTVNGVLATLDGAGFTANVPIGSAGSNPIIARVSTPASDDAMDSIRVIRMTAPLALRDSFPVADATGVDRGVAIILLFNNTLDAATVAGALQVTDASGAVIAGQLFIDRDAVTFAPNEALKANENYTVTLATSLKDASGTSLASPLTIRFTTAGTAPAAAPVVDDIETSGCFTTITLTGRASAPGARVRLDADGVTLNTVASDTGAFKFTFSFSGQIGFHIARVRQIGADGSLSSERALCFRINCELPRVIGATLDRTAKKLVIDFSRAMDPSTLVVGNTIVLDPPVTGTVTFAGQSATVAFSEDVPPVKITLTVKKEVKDLDGAFMAADYTQAFHLDTGSPERGKGYVTGAVYDATTGRPLAGANVSIAGVVTTTNDRGRYSRALDEGAYTIEASADGHTSVWRQIVVPAGAGVVPIDIRLTRRGDAGGETTVTKPVELALDSASLPPGTNVEVTAIGAQSLAGLLPFGWSPLASAEVVILSPAEGAGSPAIATPLPGAKLTFITGAAPRTLTLAQYDATRDEWRVVVAAAVVADGRVTLDISETGHYALVFPDAAAHLTHPPVPQTGGVLQGVVNPCIAEPARCTLTSRSFTLEPRAILPNGRAAATLVTEGATQIYPSGTAVQAYIDEQLNLSDGRVLVDPPFATDLLLYRTLAGDSAVADFHLAPTPQAAAVMLRDGVEHVRFVDYPGRIDRGTLLGAEGGRVPSDGGVTIDVPAGATPEPLHASAASIPASDFAPIAGFRVAGGFTLSLTRVATIPPTDTVVENLPSLVIPARATFVVPDSALVTEQIIVAEVLAQTTFGVLYRLVAIAERVDVVTGGKLFATSNIDSTQLPIDGIVRDGRYVVLVAEAPIAYAFGLVRAGPNGAAIGDARVTANNLGVTSLTPLSGLFVIPVLAKPAAPFSLVARTAATGDGATAASTSAPDVGAFVNFGTLSLVAQPPALRSVTPDGGEIAVTAAFVVRAEFDVPIDPASVASGIVVTNLTTSTALTGSVIAAGNNVTFNAGESLNAATQYAITINASIRGTNGAPFGQTVVKHFRTRSRPSDTTIRPELIRITLPDANGKSEVRGDVDSLPAGAQAVAVRRGIDFVVRYQATVASDGSFSFQAGHENPKDAIALDDLIDLQVIDPVSRGIIAVVPLTPFVSADLRSFIAPVGRDTVFLSADGIRVGVPAGAFDVPTLINVTPAVKSAFGNVPKFDDELRFGNAVELQFDGIAKKRIEVDLPVPNGVATDGHNWLFGYLGQSIRGPRVMIVDLAYANGGRFFTGLESSGGSGARYLATNAAMTGPELREHLLGVNRAGLYGAVAIETVAGPVGFGLLAGVAAHLDLFESALETIYVAHFYLTERRGRVAIPVVMGREFQIVGIDASTGLEAFTKVYDPIPIGDPGATVALPTPNLDREGPYPILGSPFRVEALDLNLEDLPIEAVRDFKVKLSGDIITATTSLPAEADVAMLNVTRGLIDPSRAGGLTLDGRVGDRIVLLVNERDVDPYSVFSIVFSERIAVPEDEDAVEAFLRSQLKITLDGQPVEGQLKIRLDAGRRVVFETPASLKRGAKYRLEISKELADESGLKIGQVRDADGVVGPELSEPLYLDFVVREPAGAVASFDLAAGVIRDQALNGNVLLVSALAGGIFAYDVSNPAGLTAATPPVGHHPGGITDYWALASDHHGRVYATGMTSLLGVVRSFRVEDFAKGNLNVQHLSSGTVSFVPGAAASMNIASRVIASDIPEAIPRKMQLLIQDAPPLEFDDRAEFKELGGAVVVSTEGDIERLLYEMPFIPARPYLVQRVTVENLTLDMRWSADATPAHSAKIEGIVARAKDRLRVVRNDMTYGVVSLLGYGVAVVDLNAIESNDLPEKPVNYQTLRELVRLTSGKLYTQCGTLPEAAIPNLEFTPDAAIRTEPGSSDIQVFALDPHRGVLDLLVKPPTTAAEAQLPPDRIVCDEYQERMSGTGLVFRTLKDPAPPADPYYDHPRLKKLRELYAERTGRAPFGRFTAAAPYIWTLEPKDNHVVTPSTDLSVPALGQRGSFAGELVQREYILVPANEYGLLVVEVGGTPPAMVHPSAPPLTQGHLVDIIWIPHGAYAARTIPRTKLATVTDGEGHVLLVDLSRLDERWNESGPIADDVLFPTVRTILETDVLTPDPRIVWRSKDPLAGGTLAPVVDPETGFVFAGKLLDRTTNVISAIDPRIQIKADLGAPDGLSEIGGVVPLGVSEPLSVKLKNPNDLAAFRFEVSLPGALSEALPGGTFELEVENERVFGGRTEDTPAGWPRAHLKIPMRRAVPASMTHLRFQRGYNKWISPWIVAVADVRASEKWKWPEGTTLAQKGNEGCVNCERPQSLKNKLEPEIFEIYTAGRLLAVRPAVSAFAGTTYEYLTGATRLDMRFASVPADTLRPWEVQIAAHNPPLAEGALQEATYVHSGEIATASIDLDAGGRTGMNVVVDRTYLSRMIGATAFGAGWDSTLFRRLRPLPDGNIEYRDGAGEVWLFVQSADGYESPRGLFLKLNRSPHGWALVDQQLRQIRFDEMGRLIAETDHLYDGNGAGNITYYLYDAKGRLGRIVDPVRRETAITYNDDGYVDQIIDWRGRKVNYFYDDGRLTRVELPEAKAADGVPAEFDHSGANRSRVIYEYDTAGSSSLTDTVLWKTNLKSIQDPAEVASGGPPRVAFTFVNDRVMKQTWGTGEIATFAYSESTTTVTDALGQKRIYTLTDKGAHDYRVHAASVVAEEVPVLQFEGTLPSTASPTMTPIPQPLPRVMSYTEDGQFHTMVHPNSLTVEFTYAPTLNNASGKILTMTKETGPSFAGSETRFKHEASANLVDEIGRIEGDGDLQNRETPQPTRNRNTTTVTDDGVSVVTTYNRVGQITVTDQRVAGSSSAVITAETKYYADSSVPLVRSRPWLIVRGVEGEGKNYEKRSFGYHLTNDGGERIEITDMVRDSTAEATFDGFGRVVREVSRDWNDTVLRDERFGYDATGRLAYHARTQSDVGTVETRVKYDAVGREIETSTTHAAVNGSPATIKSTTSYDLGNRKITRTDPTSGANVPAEEVTTIDGMGRPSLIERRGATAQTVVQRYAYGAMGWVSFESDGTRVARGYRHDLLGRTTGVVSSDGAKIGTRYTPWGEADQIIARDPEGNIVSETRNFFTGRGRLRSSNESIGSNARQTHIAVSQGGIDTVVRVGEAPAVETEDLAGLYRAQETVRDVAGHVIEERLREVGPAFDPEWTDDTWAMTKYDYIGGVPVDATVGEPKVGASYRTTTFYDGMDRPVEQTEAGVFTSTKKYDEASNVLSLKRPGMKAETASYDSRGLVTRQTLADGKTNEFRYDALGSLVERIDEAGESTFYDYDPLGRLAMIRYADGTFEETKYEDGTGAIEATRDRAGQWLSYSYDSGGRTTGVSSGQDPASAPLLVKYEYDAAGRLKLVRNKDAGVGYDDYDRLGRPGTTRTFRYLSETGLETIPAMLDVHMQRHTWSVHDERSSWRMPAVGATLPIADSDLTKWLQTIVETRDAGSNLVTQSRDSGATLMTADARSAGRIGARQRLEQPETVIASTYGFADGTVLGDIELPPFAVGATVAPTGLPLWSATSVGGARIGGSANVRDDAQRLMSLRDLGTHRLSRWGYDDRGRLTDMWLDLTSTLGAAPIADALVDADFRAARDAKAFLTPAQHALLGNQAAKIEPLTWTATRTDVHGVESRTLSLDDVDLATRNYAFAGGRRTGDGVWTYTFDELGRVTSAQNSDRRIEFTWDPNDRLVGRVAYRLNASNEWVREDRDLVLNRDGLPAATTFVWDPIVDRLVAIYVEGASTVAYAPLNGGLVRQYLHGDQGYDDPTRVLIATTPGGDPTTYFPIVDEAGTGSLAAVLDADGTVVERLLYADAYGDAPRYLQGAVADKISISTAKDALGNLSNVKVRVHLSERVEDSTLAAGARLASVTADHTLAQLSTATPELEDAFTILWSLSSTEWTSLSEATDAATLEVSLTSALHTQGWGNTSPMQIPNWARTIYSGADATPAQPVIYREPLTSIASFIESIATSDFGSQTLYEISSLYLAASEESKAKLLTGFKAAPFVEPATGLAFFRNRWYDPSTGTWLTPDALGYAAGSSNLYAGFNNDPVNNNDPDGLEALPEEYEYLRQHGADGTLLAWVFDNPRQAGSAGVGFLPVAGEIHDASQVITGYDYVSGERLAWWERGLTAGAFVIPFVGGKVVRDGVTGAVRTVGGWLDDISPFRWFDDIGNAAARGLNEGSAEAVQQLAPDITELMLREQRAVARIAGEMPSAILSTQRQISKQLTHEVAVVDRWLGMSHHKYAARYRRELSSNPQFAALIRGRIVDRRMNRWFGETYGHAQGVRIDQRIPGLSRNLRPDLFFADLGGRSVMFDIGGRTKLADIEKYRAHALYVIPVTY